MVEISKLFKKICFDNGPNAAGSSPKVQDAIEYDLVCDAITDTKDWKK
jgi:hypothetical protein